MKITVMDFHRILKCAVLSGGCLVGSIFAADFTNGSTLDPTPLIPPDLPGGFSESEEVSVEGLPSLGKWMATRHHEVAHWLNEIYFGKQLREPVNVVFLDPVAKTEAEAEARLIAAMTLAGFPIRFGHSDGYVALIGGVEYHMLPRQKRTAFSDGPFEFNNNHGRIFGPHRDASGFWFTGAFSRERVDPVGKVKHEYVSFNQARDRLAEQLDRSTFYKWVNFVDLKNHLLCRRDLTTGDHDGLAPLLIAL